jgi:hypothetical protein
LHDGTDAGLAEAFGFAPDVDSIGGVLTTQGRWRDTKKRLQKSGGQGEQPDCGAISPAGEHSRHPSNDPFNPTHGDARNQPATTHSAHYAFRIGADTPQCNDKPSVMP